MTKRRATPCVILIACLTLSPAATAQDAAQQPAGSGDARAIGQATVVEVQLADGVRTEGRLTLPPADADTPESATVRTLVVFVHGTGPGSYLTKRPLGAGRTFNYFDVFAEAFTERRIGFFSYNKRGVTNAQEPPWFDAVDREIFRTAVPIAEADDLASMVLALKRHERLADARVVLLGASEGTIVAALAAERHPDLIDAIILTGYCHDNMYDVIAYQFQGHGSMLVLGPVFDADADGVISREEYGSDQEEVARYRAAVMGAATFEVLDANADGVLDAADFAIRQRILHNMLLHAVETGNEEWIWNNYFRISIEWLRAHFALEANKTRLLRLDLPIYVLHGENDAHVPAESVRDLEARFRAVGKTNLEAYVFADHDHDLNFMEWLIADEPPAGIGKLLECVERIDAGR